MLNSYEKITTSKITTHVDHDELESAAIELKNKIEEFDVTAHVRRVLTGIEIKINYQTTDFNKSEFKQVVDKEAIISVEIDDDGISIRSPLNQHVDEWKALYLGIIEESLEQELPIDEISLESIENPKLRTKFFVNLTNQLKDFAFLDVTDVFVYHPKSDKSELLDDDSEEYEESQIGVHISKASLKGQGVLQSPELSDLYDKGFYISKIIWKSKKESYDSDIYVFEAQFAEPETCTQFSYLPKGFYKYKEGGEHNKNRTNFSSAEERALSKNIEVSAHKVMKSIISESLQANTNEDKMA
ncbi:hypothetical protein [Endozoicomonas sp. SCSIO W0465]|uniref:hypothetical protein n=1 Tax=Endozoicomonas sp. SCSIO W0465 TaxID=2918516 RepID=UPI002075D2FC|nr:hypothetical protein [Endozoicomonas sp. SCSIO W0465]USE36856.1 hypothetical protein MJO57_01015 [Endozoicomonas sp. SCSIO W0465]